MKNLVKNSESEVWDLYREAHPVKAMLQEVEALIKSGWMQGDLAAMTDGEICVVEDPDAKHYCLVGAMYRAGESYSSRVRTLAYARLGEVNGNFDLVGFNDAKSTTQRKVLNLIRKAINVV